jgi:hypothetical protein
MKSFVRQTWFIPSVAATLLGAVACASLASAQDAAVLWELQPYRVEVLVAPDESPRWTPARLERLRAAFDEEAAALVGRPWSLSVRIVPPAARRAVVAVADERRTATASDLAEWQPDSNPPGDRGDKMILVALRSAASRAEVLARELDRATGCWGPVHRAAADDDAALARQFFAAVARAFSHQCRIDGLDGERVRLRGRASGLIYRDPRFAPCATGAVFRLVRQTAGGDLLDESPTTWTFLVAESTDGRQANCRLLGGTGDVLDQLRADSSEWLALEIHAPQAASQLRIAAAGLGERADWDVRLRRDAPTAAVQLVLPAEDGTFSLPPGEPALCSVTVRTVPGIVIAHFSHLPGWPQRFIVEPPLDAAALAEAGTLGDILAAAVVRRELLLAQAVAAAGDRARAEALLTQAADALAGARGNLEQGLQRLRGRTLPDDERAAWTALCDDLAARIERELGPNRVEQVRGQLFPAAATPP